MTPRLPPVGRFRQIYSEQVAEVRRERVAPKEKARADRGALDTAFWTGLAVTVVLGVLRDGRDGTLWDAVSAAAGLITLGALLAWITTAVRRPTPVAIVAVAVAAALGWLDAGDGGWESVSWLTVGVIALVPVVVTAYRRSGRTRTG